MPIAPQQGDDVMPSVGTLVAWAMRYGLASILLVWLVYIGVTQVVLNVRHNGDLIQQHSMEAAATTSRVLESLARTERRQERIESILRQSCVNAAKDDTQRQACWAAGDR